MSASLYTFAEPLLVALIVLVSAVVVLRKHAPKLWTRLTGKAAAANCHDGSNKSIASSSCGSGCGSCGSTAPVSQTIKLHKARP